MIKIVVIPSERLHETLCKPACQRAWTGSLLRLEDTEIKWAEPSIKDDLR